MSPTDYDVIIIGGRCAGATLALRLAEQKLKVLVVDRATFPSQPAVASSPFIYSETMQMLSDLGLSEEEYSLPGSRADHMVLDFVDNFFVTLPCSIMQVQRNYVRGLDRAHFDNTLWKHMERKAPYITLRQGFAVSGVLNDTKGAVTGIIGKSQDGENENITADLVVGADGRFSMAAQKFGAKMVEERNEFTGGGYEAQWENVLPYANGFPTEVSLYSTSRGFAMIFVPVSHGRYHVAAYMRSQDVQRGNQTPQEFYLSSMQRIPKAWKRLEGARQVTELEGIRKVENAYREAYGPGWALVGDAFHYKDPVDGQGIYDALTETKYLAEAIGEWKSGKLTWEQAGITYNEKAMAATYPMFNMTVKRVQRELHSFPPKFIINTVIKWMLTDPEYQTKFLRALARVAPPSDVPAGPTLGMIGRGIMNSLKSFGKDSNLPKRSEVTS
jgi:2-polyprenyl-6-methoxyphenol hydroxylase-like FAD-dependent oxidoreductase